MVLFPPQAHIPTSLFATTRNLTYHCIQAFADLTTHAIFTLKVRFPPFFLKNLCSGSNTYPRVRISRKMKKLLSLKKSSKRERPSERMQAPITKKIRKSEASQRNGTIFLETHPRTTHKDNTLFNHPYIKECRIFMRDDNGSGPSDPTFTLRFLDQGQVGQNCTIMSDNNLKLKFLRDKAIDITSMSFVLDKDYIIHSKGYASTYEFTGRDWVLYLEVAKSTGNYKEDYCASERFAYPIELPPGLFDPDRTKINGKRSFEIFRKGISFHFFENFQDAVECKGSGELFRGAFASDDIPNMLGIGHEDYRTWLIDGAEVTTHPGEQTGRVERLEVGTFEPKFVPQNVYLKQESSNNMGPADGCCQLVLFGAVGLFSNKPNEKSEQKEIGNKDGSSVEPSRSWWKYDGKAPGPEIGNTGSGDSEKFYLYESIYRVVVNLPPGIDYEEFTIEIRYGACKECNRRSHGRIYTPEPDSHDSTCETSVVRLVRKEPKVGMVGSGTGAEAGSNVVADGDGAGRVRAA